MRRAGERPDARRCRLSGFVSQPAPPSSFSFRRVRLSPFTHVVTPLYQVGAQVGAHKAGPARDEDPVGLDAGLGLDDGRFLWTGGERF